MTYPLCYGAPLLNKKFVSKTAHIFSLKIFFAMYFIASTVIALLAYLLLEFVDQILHMIMLLHIFLRLELQLFKPSLGLSKVLGGVAEPPLLPVQVVLHVVDASLELGCRLLAVLEGVHFSLIQTNLKIFQLGFGDLTLTLQC